MIRALRSNKDRVEIDLGNQKIGERPHGSRISLLRDAYVERMVRVVSEPGVRTIPVTLQWSSKSSDTLKRSPG